VCKPSCCNNRGGGGGALAVVVIVAAAAGIEFVRAAAGAIDHAATVAADALVRTVLIGCALAVAAAITGCVIGVACEYRASRPVRARARPEMEPPPWTVEWIDVNHRVSRGREGLITDEPRRALQPPERR
jgi:hypothetical protein